MNNEIYKKLEESLEDCKLALSIARSFAIFATVMLVGIILGFFFWEPLFWAASILNALSFLINLGYVRPKGERAFGRTDGMIEVIELLKK